MGIKFVEKVMVINIKVSALEKQLIYAVLCLIQKYMLLDIHRNSMSSQDTNVTMQ